MHHLARVRSVICVVLTSGDKLEADLDRAQKKLEQLKTDHEAALERKEKEVSV